MYKMLIADDEKIIRESLSAAIDWTSLGVEVTAVCADGIELYKYLFSNILILQLFHHSYLYLKLQQFQDLQFFRLLHIHGFVML